MSPKLVGRGPGRREAPRRIVGAIVACVLVLLLAAGVIWIVVTNPTMGIVKPVAAPSPACRYSSAKVAVVITGPDCYIIMREITDASDKPWGLARPPLGEEFSQLGKGPDVIRVYESGNKPFAGALSNYFLKSGWTPQEPTTPAPSP